jgi:hypothetical protein
MLRLTVLGPDSQIGSSLCAQCPHSPAGCCVAPPPLTLTDLARIVKHGGRDWLVDELAAKRLVRAERGLGIARKKARISDARGAPRLTKCVFHGPSGCTIHETRRSVTCNMYICESALTENKTESELARTAREAHARIMSEQVRIGERLLSEMSAAFPEGPVFDAAFFDWLVFAYERALITEPVPPLSPS